jgi:hypothetical protein
MDEVCERVYEEFGISCGSLDEPIVIITDILPNRYHGIYAHGEEYIFINASSPKPVNEIVAHETVHYVLYELGLPLGRCESEAHARSWASEITGAPIDPNWRDTYGCKLYGWL